MIVSQLNLVEIDFEDEVYALILLFSLPNNWNIVVTVTVVSNSSRSTSLTFNGV